MSEVLYRKYRPQTFAEVAGQTHIRVTLQHQLQMDKLAHAYLFCGPRGVSKTTMARILAKAVNCSSQTKENTEPCNQCASCKEVTESRSLDVLEMDAASHTGVDNVRQNIIDNSRFVPTRSKYKIFIIDEVHMLSTSAFNALLKTLEEPPSHVLFILVTTEAHKIPATIISRCQRFDFHKIARLDILASLHKVIQQEGREIEDTVLDRIVRAADGCLRDALSLLDQVISLGEQKITLEQVELILPEAQQGSVLAMGEYLANHDTPHALHLVNDLAANGVDFVHLFSELIEFYRKLLISKVTHSLEEFIDERSDTDLERLQKILAHSSAEELLFVLSHLLRERSEMKSAPIPQLPLEIAIVCICLRVTTTSPSVSFTGGFSEKKTLSLSPISSSGEQSEQSKNPLESSKMLTLKIVQSRWNEVVEKVSAEYHSLALLLRVGRPLSMKGARLTLGFQFKLHKERVNDVKNRDIVMKALEEVFQQKIEVVCDVSEHAKIDILPLEEMVTAEIGDESSAQDDPQVSAILKEFGGRLVS